MPEYRVHIDSPTECKNCGSTDLSWLADVKNRSGVMDGRLRANDLAPVLVLGCNECSETLAVFPADIISGLTLINAESLSDTK